MAKTILEILGTSTPVSEQIAKELGLVKAAIVCRVFFYQQLKKGICYASNKSFQDSLGLSAGAVSTNLKWLLDNDWIINVEPLAKGNRNNHFKVTQKFYDLLERSPNQEERSGDERNVQEMNGKEEIKEYIKEKPMPVGNFEGDYSDLFPEDTSSPPSPGSPNGKEGKKGISPESVFHAAAARNQAAAQDPREHPVYKVFRDYDPEAAAEFLSLLSTVPNDYPDFQGALQPLLCAFIAVTGARPLIAGEGRLASQTKRQWKAELQYHLDNFRDEKPELSVPKIAYLYLQAMSAYRKSTKNDFPVVKSPNTLTAYMATEITRYEKRKPNGNESKS